MPTNSKVLELFPHPGQETALHGLYLSHKLHEAGSENAPYVYANFLSSLDGRIALKDEHSHKTYIPKHLKTASDFRLFLELHAQADCLITHGGYLRALQDGELGNILQVNDDDLSAWRRNNGLKAQPDVIIASASLDFPMHDSLRDSGQQVYIATGRKADPQRVAYWMDQGYRVLFAGDVQLVQGAALVNELSKLGYKSIYLIAGPQMLDTMVRENQLGSLYLTITHQLMGGKEFRSLMTGEMLEDAGNLCLSSLYYEADSPAGAGQFFMNFTSGRS